MQTIKLKPISEIPPIGVEILYYYNGCICFAYTEKYINHQDDGTLY